MAIKAIVESGRDIPESRIVELAEHERDEFGKSFTLIRLLAIPRDNRGTGARFHEVGYQDAFITVDSNSGIRIKYGPEGRGDVMFEKNELGKLISVLPKTPWNMEVLASSMLGWQERKEQPAWKIMDADIEDEAKSLMKKLPQPKKVAAAPEDTIQKDLEMIKKHETIKQREQEKREPEAFLGASALKEDLMKTTYNKLLERAKLTGGWTDKINKREDLVNIIMTYETAKTNKEALPVE